MRWRAWMPYALAPRSLVSSLSFRAGKAGSLQSLSRQETYALRPGELYIVACARGWRRVGKKGALVDG